MMVVSINMKIPAKARLLLVIAAAGAGLCWIGSASNPGGPPVSVLRVPDSGIQPQVLTNDGVIHLLYFTGDPLKGNLNYVNSRDYGRTFSKPLRVNTQPGSALASGNIRGGQMALGRNGRLHVAWIGSSLAQPRLASNSAPVLYTRLNDAGNAFEPERSVSRLSWDADGATLAADSHDNVFVFWHGERPQGKGEDDRRLWLAKSIDGGRTFAGETVASDGSTGVCGCCGARAFADASGSLYVLFRAASQTVHRDMFLLSSNDHGATFQGSDISHWNIGACVMSSASLIQSSNGVLAAWESEKQVYFGRVRQGANKLEASIGAPGTGQNRKYPALAVNSRGETLFVWTEAMAWKKGGSAVWQAYGKELTPEGSAGKAEGVPAWGLVAAFARPDGSFAVLY
jgi:hypothetical protein